MHDDETAIRDEAVGRPGKCELLRFAVETAELGLYDADLAGGAPYWSPHLCAILERASDAAPATPDTVPDWVHGADAEAVRAALARAFDPGGDGRLCVEHRIVRPDGAVRWVQMRGQVRFAEDGAARRPVRSTGIVLDITARKEAEAAQRASEERLELALEAAQAGIWEWDVGTGENRWSEGLWTLYGLEPHSCRPSYDAWLSTVHPDDRDRAVRLSQDAAARGAELVIEWRVCGPDGRVRWLMSRGRPRRDAAGQALGYRGIVLDITERKAAEAALRESERRLDLALDSGGMGMWEWDVRSDRSVWNAKEYEVLGLPAGAGREPAERFLALVHPEDLPGFEAGLAAVMREGRDWSDECRIVRPDGAVRWLAAVGRLFRDAHGRPERMIGINYDIDARKRAQERLRESEERFRKVFEHAGMGIVVGDLEGRLVQSNPAFRALLGYTQEELDGMDFAALVHPEDRAANLAQLRRLYEEDLPYFAIENRYVRKDGTPVWVQKCISLLHDARGQPAHLVALVTDIDARRRMEQALRESDRRKDEFLATLGHELRNPLAPIRNACAILKLRGSADPTVEAARDMIDRQVTHLVRLVDDLLEVGRITRGKLRLQTEPLELATVLERAVEIARPCIDEAGHTLVVALPCEPVRIDGDPVRLAQLFANLLVNACKYTPDGGRIRLEVERGDAQALVRVTDNGIGIPPEHLPEIFEMFHQVPAHDGQVQSGLGIGLALVRGLAEMHGGRVTAASDGPGRGSAFTVSLPAHPVRSVARAADPQPPDAPASVAGRVLVADDQADIVDSLAFLLSLHGVEVEIARDGDEALAAAERCCPDLVLLDLGMPRLDGYGACRQMRERPWGKELAIVALTGWGQDSDRQRSEEAGFDAHWVKPVAPSAVLDLLGKVRAARLAGRGAGAEPQDTGRR